ncbi:uncharacterized protein LOC121376879 isoform X2 [Gigantopelta aegis]|nr:uncharacterized protein LOC121376879 isoform X2 [Gigantopelta aegis]
MHDGMNGGMGTSSISGSMGPSMGSSSNSGSMGPSMGSSSNSGSMGPSMGSSSNSGSMGPSMGSSSNSGPTGQSNGAQSNSGPMGQGMQGPGPSTDDGGLFDQVDMLGPEQFCTLTEGEVRGGMQDMKNDFGQLVVNMEQYLNKIESQPLSSSEHWLEVAGHIRAASEETMETFQRNMMQLIGVFFRLRGHPSFKDEATCRQLRDLKKYYVENPGEPIIPADMRNSVLDNIKCFKNEIKAMFEFEIPKEQLSEKQVIRNTSLLLTEMILFAEEFRVFIESAMKLHRKLEQTQGQGQAPPQGQQTLQDATSGFNMQTRELMKELLGAINRRGLRK